MVWLGDCPAASRDSVTGAVRVTEAAFDSDDVHVCVAVSETDGGTEGVREEEAVRETVSEMLGLTVSAAVALIDIVLLGVEPVDSVGVAVVGASQANRTTRPAAPASAATPPFRPNGSPTCIAPKTAVLMKEEPPPPPAG